MKVHIKIATVGSTPRDWPDKVLESSVHLAGKAGESEINSEPETTGVSSGRVAQQYPSKVEIVNICTA